MFSNMQYQKWTIAPTSPQIRQFAMLFLLFTVENQNARHFCGHKLQIS